MISGCCHPDYSTAQLKDVMKAWALREYSCLNNIPSTGNLVPQLLRKVKNAIVAPRRFVNKRTPVVLQMDVPSKKVICDQLFWSIVFLF